jgi:hypothetical protein
LVVDDGEFFDGDARLLVLTLAGVDSADSTHLLLEDALATIDYVSQDRDDEDENVVANDTTKV